MIHVLLAAALAAQPTQPPHNSSPSKAIAVTAAALNGTWYGPMTPPAQTVNRLIISTSGTQSMGEVWAFCSRPTRAFCKVTQGHLTLSSSGAQGQYQNGATVFTYTVIPLADGSLQFVVSFVGSAGKQAATEVLYKTAPLAKPHKR